LLVRRRRKSVPLPVGIEAVLPDWD